MKLRSSSRLPSVPGAKPQAIGRHWGSELFILENRTLGGPSGPDLGDGNSYPKEKMIGVRNWNASLAPCGHRSPVAKVLLLL